MFSVELLFGKSINLKVVWFLDLLFTTVSKMHIVWSILKIGKFKLLALTKHLLFLLLLKFFVPELYRFLKSNLLDWNCSLPTPHCRAEVSLGSVKSTLSTACSYCFGPTPTRSSDPSYPSHFYSTMVLHPSEIALLKHIFQMKYLVQFFTAGRQGGFTYN